MPGLYASDVDNMFKFHPPSDESVSEMHTQVRLILGDAAMWLFSNVPESPERGKAIEKLREAMFWANAGIACNQQDRG